MANPAVKELPEKDLHQVMIYGRISHVSSNEGIWYHSVTLPAADTFSSPDEVQVTSKQRLGRPGEEVSCLTRIRGYVRRFKYRKGNEEEEGREHKTRFEVVE